MKTLLATVVTVYWIIHQIKSIDYTDFIPSMSSLLTAVVITLITYAGLKRGLHKKAMIGLSSLLDSSDHTTIIKSKVEDFDGYTKGLLSKDDNLGGDRCSYKSVRRRYYYYKNNN
jgi:hypothetical protein